MNKGGRCAPKVTLENLHNTALLEHYPQLGSLAYFLAQPQGYFVAPFVVLWSYLRKT